MDRAVEHPVRGVERRLRPVAVVQVPVHDGDPIDLAERPGRGDGNVVEETESHGPVRHGMVPWRAHQGKRVLAVERLLHRLPGGPGSIQGRIKRSPGEVGVRVDVAGPARGTRPAERADGGDVPVGVH